MSAQRLTHAEAYTLLPWLVNGTLSGAERRAVEAHAGSCLLCRAALREEREIAAVVQRQPTIGLSAEAQLGGLMRRIAEPGVRPARPRRAAATLARLLEWPALPALVAAGLLICVGAVLFATGHVGADRATPFNALGDAPPAGTELDLVPVQGTTDAELRSLVADIGGVIVAGPSAIGRYRIRLGADATDIDAVLAQLRADRRVRLVAPALTAEGEPAQ